MGLRAGAPKRAGTLTRSRRRLAPPATVITSGDSLDADEWEQLQEIARRHRRYQRLSARGALHVVVMARHGLTELMSFDRGCDAYPGINRLA
jgi:predicted nucleic acid-binding protein